MDRTSRTAGVDVGGTKVAVGLLDGTTLTPHELEPTELDEPEALLAQIVRLVGGLGPVDSVGIGVPSSSGSPTAA
jgi:glucokinase